MDPNSDNGGSVVDGHDKVILSDMGGGSPEAGSGDKSTIDKSSANPVNRESVAESMDNPRIRNDIEGETTKSVDVAELAQSRMEAQKQQQMVRKAAWLAESRKEVLERQVFAQTNLLEHLDLVAWDGIVDNLGPEEKVKMSIMAWEWRSRLERERVLFLFQKVFPILSKHTFEAVSPTFEAQHAALTSVLRCRLVCKSWKEVINEYLSIHHTTTPATIFNEPGQPTRDATGHSTPILETSNQVRLFNLWSEQTGRNPFFSRKFIANSSLTGGLRIDVEYWNEVEKMLQRLGGELWTLDLMFDKGSLEMMYIILCRILRLTPNLRRLFLADRDRTGSLDVGQDAFGPLKLRMERTPLPQLPHLSSIVFGEIIPAPLVQAALAMYGDSLEVVEFHGVGQDQYTGGYFDPGEFLSERPLPLQKYTCNYGNSKNEGESVTPQISHWNYQFSSLHELSLTYRFVQEGADLANIFKTVNSCGSTLRRLLLLFDFGFDSPQASDWRNRLPKGLKLELPHLEELDLLIIQTKITDVDFLLPLVSLKTLTFSYDAIRADDAVENGTGIIQFAGYRDRLYESNLWKLLPELRLATIKMVPVVEEWTNVKFLGIQIPHPIQEPKKITVYDREGYRKHFMCRVLTSLLEFLHSQRLSAQ